MKDKKMKVLFVFGTRPEAIKLAPVILELQKHPDDFQSKVCVTAQHREMLDQVLKIFDISPDYDLDIMKKNQDLFEITANALAGIKEVLKKEQPDLVLVQGDTTTTFVAALAAFYLKIPIAHIEAGLRTGNRYSPFPEEINRRLTSVMADFHFAPTKEAEKNLILEGFEKSSIFVTGNTGIDALMAVVNGQKTEDRKRAMEEYFLKKWNIALTADKDKSKLILVTGHRRESFGEGFKRICKALRILAEDNLDVQIVYPVHLNPNVQEPVYSILGGMNNIHLIPPLDYEPFVFLMSRSYLILTDSGGIQEEAPSLGVPVLVMRDTSERTEGIEAGSARLVGTDTQKIVIETQRLLNDKIEYERMAKTINPYGDGHASKRIFRIISEHFRRCK